MGCRTFVLERWASGLTRARRAPALRSFAGATCPEGDGGDGRSMRALAVFPSERAVRVVEHPAPTITRPDQVSLTMLDVGVCGTDREIARFEYGIPPPGEPYLVLGHESLARVREVGDAVTRMAPGDLVVTTVRRPCPDPECRPCVRGRQDFCLTGDFTERGIKARHGFMAEEVVEEERYLHVVPPALREVGVLVEPLTIAEKALQQVWDVQSRMPWTLPGAEDGRGRGHRALVLGAGPVALLGCLALLVRGFETWVYSRDAEDSLKARWVESLGARYRSSEVLPLDGLQRELGRIDLVYEATGAAGLSFEVLQALGTNGVFVFTGVPGRKGPIEIDAPRLMRRLVLQNQLVFGTVNAGPDAFETAIRDLALFHARWPSALAALITDRVPLDDAPALITGTGGGIKRLVRVAGGA